MPVVRELRSICARHNSDWCANRCRRAGCTVRLDGVPQSHVIFDIEAHQQQENPGEKCCDFLIAYEEQEGGAARDNLAAVELKASIRATEVREQLQKGAAAAEHLLGAMEIKTFIPVVAGHAHREEIAKLKDYRIRFGNRREQIELIACGDRLMDAVNRAKAAERRRRP